MHTHRIRVYWETLSHFHSQHNPWTLPPPMRTANDTIIKSRKMMCYHCATFHVQFNRFIQHNDGSYTQIGSQITDTRNGDLKNVQQWGFTVHSLSVRWVNMAIMKYMKIAGLLSFCVEVNEKWLLIWDCWFAMVDFGCTTWKVTAYLCMNAEWQLV